DLARELDKRARARSRVIEALVEVNGGGEASKSGVAPDGLGALLEAIAAGARGDPTRREGSRRLARLVPRPPQARRAARPDRALDGHEQRFRGGDRGRRDGGPGRHGHLRPAPAAGSRMTIKGRTVGFLGAGNMGEALIKGLLAAKLVPAQAIFATDVRPERPQELEQQYGIQVSSHNAELVQSADIVILAVKPQIMDAVATETAPAVTRRKRLILVGGGVSTDKIRARLPRDSRLIRGMPKTPGS